MSGSSIGGVVGGAIGYYIGGPQGAQIGWMIGSAVGGAVDPDVIKGQRLSDAQIQTSSEGVPRPIIYGTAVVAGNLIQRGPLVEHKHRDRTGKGGPVQESFTYSMTYAIRVCEASPLGECLIRRIWRDDKLVYDVRDPATPDDGTEQSVWAAVIAAMRADTAAFASKLTVYTGSEDQLPDPTLEALPAENGGGVGNVPAYRGSCYVVIANDDLTERQGTIPQYRFEVVSVGTIETITTLAGIGLLTGTVDREGAPQSAYLAIADDGGVDSWIDPFNGIGSGVTITTGSYRDGMGGGFGPPPGLTYQAPAEHPTWRMYSRGHFVEHQLYTRSTWSISAEDNFGSCRLLSNGSPAATLVPYAGAAPDWWYGEGLGDPEYGGLVWFSQGVVYIGVRRTGSVTTDWQQVFSWPLATVGGADLLATSTLDVFEDGVTGRFWMHMDSGGTVRMVAVGDDGSQDIVALTGARTPIPTSINLDGLVAFGVDRGLLFLLVGDVLTAYSMDDFSLVDSIELAGTPSTRNHRILFTPTSIWIQAGATVHRIEYHTFCLTSTPYGWHTIPDMPGYLTDGSQIAPLCSLEESKVTSEGVPLSAIVTDLCKRAGVTADQIDVSRLTDTVRGFVVGRQLPAADAIRSLQQGYFFDFPEWGNAEDNGTKLRGIPRGGESLFAITDADLVESDDDQDTRAQAVEFPRKINLITSDPSVNYEPTKQTFERRTDNVKAVGETTIELPLSLIRDEAAQKVDIMGKVAWTEAEGRCEFQLPEEFSQLTPSDPFTKSAKRWRAERCEYGDGVVKVEAVRDRASAYTSTATGSVGLPPTQPVSNIRGPTIFGAFNFPSLRSADNSPGMYVAARGLLPAWNGCRLQLSVDGGETFQNVLDMVNPAILGKLTANVSASGEPITVQTYGDTLGSVSDAQIAARANAFAIDAVLPEIGRFKTATETDDNIFELTDLTRGELGTPAAEHFTGNTFVMLDSGLYFLPLDISLAGKTLIFRPVTFGTAEANNATYEVVFVPQFTTVPPVSFLLDESGEIMLDEVGGLLSE